MMSRLLTVVCGIFRLQGEDGSNIASIFCISPKIKINAQRKAREGFTDTEICFIASSFIRTLVCIYV